MFEHKKLQMMVDYCHTPECQRKYILEYFGETGVADECGNCGNCRSGGEIIDITEDAQKVLSCVARMRERYGVTTVVDVLRGSKNKKLIGFGLDKLSTYGILNKWKTDEVKNFVNRLVATGYLMITEGDYPLLKLTLEANPVLKGRNRIWQKVFSQKVNTVADDVLFEELRKLRKEIADREQVPAYIIFSDSTLKEMSVVCPKDLAQLSQIKGIGAVKLGKYGEEFLAVIKPYVKTASPETENATEVPSHVETLRMYSSGKTIEDIAASRGLKPLTIQDHLVRCSKERMTVNWDALIPAQYEKMILAAISRIGVERLKPIKEALPKEIDYMTIKAVICKHFNIS